MMTLAGVLAGCEKPNVGTGQVEQVPPLKEKTGNCQVEEVAIEGYGDKGKRLSNCFVEYPGEPTRQDKSYYVVEDICGQFTKELMEGVLGKTIVKVKPPEIDSLDNCSYYWDDKDYLMLVMEYLKAENQKKGHESMGRMVKEEPTIPMKNYVVYQEDGVINTIYLILGENKFISLKGAGVTVETAEKVAEVIKNYK